MSLWVRSAEDVLHVATHLLLFLLASLVVKKRGLCNLTIWEENEDFKTILKKLFNKLYNCSVRNVYIYIYRNMKPEFLIFILNKLQVSQKIYKPKLS